MKAKSSIHIAPGHNGYYAHNSRETFSHSQVFSDEENEYYNDAKTAFKKYQEEMYFRSEAYTKRTRQRLQSKTVTHLSAIINLHDYHMLDDIEPICEHLQKTLDTVITQKTIHKDEGKMIHKVTGEILTSGIDFFMDPTDNKLYYDKEYTEEIDVSDWEVEKNIHAHIEMLGIDSNGTAIKRNKLNRYYLSELQSFTAKILGMERGQQQETYTREQMDHIKSNMKPRPEYKNKKDYGTSFNQIAKQLGYLISNKKRLDTHEYKAKMKSQNELNNEKRKARDILAKKEQDIRMGRSSLMEAHSEAGMWRGKVIKLEQIRKSFEKKEEANKLTISTLEKEIIVLLEKHKVLEENNRELVYAKGWKRNSEPVEKDELIDHLQKKGKKAISEKQLYVDKCDSLQNENKEINDENEILRIENDSVKEELQENHHIIEMLGHEVEGLRDKALEIEQSKITPVEEKYEELSHAPHMTL